VARSVAERYLVAAFSFVAAATWLGVGLANGLACLLVFVLALQAVRLYQRRSSARSRRAPSRRGRPSRYEPSPEEKERPLPATSRRDRNRPSGRVYDGGRDEIGWPVTREASW
jgi:hypothetical protein